MAVHCTLVRLTPPIPPNPLCPLKAIARGFIVLFHVCIQSPSTIFPHLHLLHSPSSLPQAPPHTRCAYFIVLSFFINSKSMFKRVSWCIPAVNILYFGLFSHFCYSSLPFPSYPHIQQLSVYIMSSSCTDVFHYCWLSFSFPSLLPLSAID
jgi:hypothetical protein